MKKLTAIVACLLLMLLGMTACGVQTTFTVDDVDFDLSSDWSFDTDEYTFTKDGDSTTYTFIDDSDQVGDCSSAKERAATYSPSDGIDVSTITVAGQDAVLAVEPVNEIQDCNIYFYKDGQEYLINYEIDADAEPINDTTQELIDSVEE